MASEISFEITDKILKRFWKSVKVLSENECWETKSKYANFYVKPKQYQSHRVSYYIAYGEVPADLCVLHKCDNPYCVNPKHLFLGTKKDNSRDMVTKGRHGKSMLGKTHTQEEKVKISLRTKGELNPFFGRKHTDETKKLISLKCKEYWKARQGV